MNCEVLNLSLQSYLKVVLRESYISGWIYSWGWITSWGNYNPNPSIILDRNISELEKTAVVRDYYSAEGSVDGAAWHLILGTKGAAARLRVILWESATNYPITLLEIWAHDFPFAVEWICQHSGFPQALSRWHISLDLISFFCAAWISETEIT